MFVQWEVDFFSQGVVNNTLLVEAVMCKWRVIELAGSKGVKIRVTPSKGVSSCRLKPAMIRRRITGKKDEA